MSTTSGAVPYASWGDPAEAPPLTRQARAFLGAELGPLDGPGPPPAVGEVAARVAESALTPDARAALSAAAGRQHLLLDPTVRAACAGGLSYLDLVRRRDGEVGSAPDAVVRPGDAAEVRAVLDACRRHDVALVPRGGGTSVVAGVEPDTGAHRAVVVVDLARMDRVIAVDPVAHTVTVQPGLTGPALELVLDEDGLTLGHFPQSYTRATVGGWVAARSAGQASTTYGRVDEMVTGLRLAAPAGDLHLGRAPASAAGPDLLRLVVGSEGAFGILTEITLRVRPAAAVSRYEGWVLPAFETGTDVLRSLVQAGAAPDVARLADPDETRAGLALTGPTGAAGALARAYVRRRGGRQACLLVLGWEGRATDVAVRRAEGRRAVRRAGGASLGARAGQSWRRHRFDGPYLRDTLLSEGVCVETLETAAGWSSLPETYGAVRAALTHALSASGTPPMVGCHVSHLYETGASLYFTVLAARRAGGEVAQWQQAKRAASAAIVASGATITHHHGVGREHRRYLDAEIGELGVTVLRNIKHTLDPTDVCNPGVLLP